MWATAGSDVSDFSSLCSSLKSTQPAALRPLLFNVVPALHQEYMNLTIAVVSRDSNIGIYENDPSLRMKKRRRNNNSNTIMKENVGEKFKFKSSIDTGTLIYRYLRNSNNCMDHYEVDQNAASVNSAALKCGTVLCLSIYINPSNITSEDHEATVGFIVMATSTKVAVFGYPVS